MLNDSLRISPHLAAEFNVLPARFSAQAVLVELFNIFERKLTHICSDEAQVSSNSKGFSMLVDKSFAF